MLCSKLSKGIGHNYYGEPAWPNDILYIFPIVICGVILLLFGLAIHQPYKKSEHANPQTTPLEILPEWYLLATFNLLRILSSKFIGIFSMLYLPGVLLVLPFGKTWIDITILEEDQEWYLFSNCSYVSIWLSIGPLEVIIKALPLM